MIAPSRLSMVCCLAMLALAAAWAADEPPATAPADPAITATTPTEAAPARRVAYIPIHHQIDELRERYFKRALKEARAAKVDAVVVHLSTDGGHLGAASEMTHAALEVPQDQPRLVAFIDNRAWSAGAMIAYAHDDIYMTSIARIGDIGVITIGADGMEYAPEKIQTAVRAELRSAAQANGWNVAKISKMTALDQDLYRFDLPSGPEFVIEDDLGAWLAAHPTVDPDSKITILGEDRLLSYTAQEAVAEGMATAVVADLDAVYARLGTTAAQVLDLSPTGVENASWYLAGWTSLLASLTVLFIILEVKTPGVGLWAALAAVCGVAFFVCQYYQELAGNLELVMIGIGLLMIVGEIFWLATGGIVGFSGLGLCVLGLLLSFMPNDIQFDPAAPGYARFLGDALANSTLSLVMIAVGMLVLIRVLPTLKAVDRIAATAEITGTSAGATELGASQLVGRRAIARTDLRPSGFITIDGQELSASTEHGEYLIAGSAVEVVAVRFGDAVVHAAPGSA